MVNWCNLEFWIHRSVKASKVCVQGLSLLQECVFRVLFNYSDIHSLGVYSFSDFFFFLFFV